MSRVASRTFLIALTALMAFLSTSIATAQEQRQRGRGNFGGGFAFGGFGGRETPGGDWLTLLQNEKVQKEIDLLAEQTREIDKVREQSGERMRSVFQGMGNLREASEQEREKAMREMGEKREAVTKETVKQLEGILLPPQVARLKEISLQSRGTRALSDPQVQKELDLTADQQGQITKISEEGDQKRRALFTDRGGNRDELGAKMEAIRKESNDKTLAVLNSAQREKLEKMKGKPVSFDLAELQRGFGGGRGPGGPGGAGGPGGRPGGDRRRNDN